MTEPFRLRPSLTAIKPALFCCLLSVSLLSAAADYPRDPVPHSKTLSGRSQSTAASIALFEKNDARRAARLARFELVQNSRKIEPWFVSMEAAVRLHDSTTVLRSAMAICSKAKENDPRLTAAAARLSELGSSQAVRERPAAWSDLLTRDSACQSAAENALYEAALTGVPAFNVRALAQRAGWLTKWTVVRNGNAANPFLPEQFEFADARIRVPDYFPASARYTATSMFNAASDGQYLLAGDLAETTITIDDHEIEGTGPVSLQAGEHQVRLSFRASAATPRVRIFAAHDSDESVFDHLAPREGAHLRAILTGNDSPSSSAIAELPHAAEAQNAPDSLGYAHSLVSHNRHADAIAEINRILREWPLDRDAHRLLIAELQRIGNNATADRAAADFLAIAPNARGFRRMALSAGSSLSEEVPFYEPYRRPAPSALTPSADETTPTAILLQDKVAITRKDGSVSMYMHRVMQIMTPDGIELYRPLALPQGAEILSSRVVNDGVGQPLSASTSLRAGDEIEEEYVVNYTGDGGMISHPEAFQYVFSDFESPLLDARFVVLSPAAETPGYVISSGAVPSSRMEHSNGLLAQIWDFKAKPAPSGGSAPPIIRVVENENGWSIPPSVERRRILESIHPGPRPREA